MIYLFVWKKLDGLKYLEISEFVTNGVTAVFSSRIGGFSSGAYESLNLALHTEDDSDVVVNNRKIFCKNIGLDHKKLVAGEQVHGDKVYVVKDKDKGRGATSFSNCISGVDALITNKKGVPLISFYADCVPLFILDLKKEVIGLAHAGWKGTLLKIGNKTITRMNEYFGTLPGDCWVGIGPSISRDNYEVDDKVVNKFKRIFSDWRKLVVCKDNGYYNLDLKLSNYLLFRDIGVPEEQIIVSDYCTFKDKDLFYSYRRDNGKTGRMASIISL